MMNKFSLIVAVATFAVAGSAYAAGSNPISAADNEVGIAATGTLMNYQEHITPGPSDTESGWTPGFAIKGSYLRDNIYAALRYDYSSGDITYHGALQGDGARIPYTGTDDATTQRLLGRVGYAFWLTPKSLLTPYAAAGWQHWNRDLTGPYGYTEDYSSALAGAGIMYQYACTPRLVSTINAEYLAVVGGSMTPKLDNGLYGTANFSTSGEEKIGVTEDYRFSGNWHLYGGLSYTHFNYTGGLFFFIFVVICIFFFEKIKRCIIILS